MTRYRWVADRKAEGFPITMACAVAEVSRQAFYDWRLRVVGGPSEAEQAEAGLVSQMREIHDEFDKTYGSPRMTVELANQGKVVNHKRVERLMRLHGMVGVHQPAKVRTTIRAEHHPPLPDLLRRDFTVGRPDVAWVSDITYIPTGEGWLYLATVLDLGSRRLLGYSMATHMRTSLIRDALEMAAGVRGGVTAGIIFHSDRGSQYLSREFAQTITGYEMVQSVGRTGQCWDNSVAESFFSSLKRELVSRYRFDDRTGARRAIFTWINRYNTRRLHSTLGYLPPIEWENTYHQQPTHQAA
ncbi:MAG: IS3 family transposase [Actinomycetales bacterium]|nr:IS3 family transposase [Actinomycetales bacterium]